MEKTKLEKQYHWFDKSGRSNYHGINRLIKRLSLIILSAESKGDRTQVMYKSKHILKTQQLKLQKPTIHKYQRIKLLWSFDT